MKTTIALFIAGLAIPWILPAQVEPHAGQWQTWIIPSDNSYRLPPPDAAATADEIAWVQEAVANRTPAALSLIRYWDSGAPAYRWMQLAERLAVSESLPAPMQTRALSLVAAAIYDATIATWDTKYTYMRQHPNEVDKTISAAIPPTDSPSYPSEHAVTAAAAAAVLGYLFPDQASAVADMATEAGWSRIVAGVAFPSDVAAGLDLGNQVGKAVAAFADADGSGLKFTGSFPPAAGVWSSNTPVTPLAGTWHPWVLASAGQFRPAPPPPAGSSDAAAQYDAVRNLQRTNSTNHLAWFWQPGFFQPWLQQVEREIFEKHLDSNAPRAARVYALETIAQHDATLACWDAKYSYLELRPPQADPAIVPLFALPQHPGYPSGHACASGASAEVMAFLFPDEAVDFRALAADAGTSTFDALIHTQLDVSVGLRLGEQVGSQVVTRAQSDGAN